MVKMDRFLEWVNREGPVTILLRCHVYLEHELADTIRAAIPRPEYLDLERAGFARLVALANALALIEEDTVSALTAVNVMRNRLAHSLEHDIGPAEEDALVVGLSDRLRIVALGEDGTDYEFPERLRNVLAMLVIWLQRVQERIAATHRQTQEVFASMDSVVELLSEARAKGILPPIPGRRA